MIEDFSHEQIEDIAEKLMKAPHCEHIMMIDKKGQIVMHNFSDESSAQKIKTLAREAIRLSNKFSRECRAGKHKNILLEGDFGKILVTAGPIKGCSAAITGSKLMNTGMLHALLEESRAKLTN